MSSKHSSGSNRIRTFEIDTDETLIVQAGRDELGARTIYRGRGLEGRYTIVPTDTIARAAPDLEADDLVVDALQVCGETVAINDGVQQARLCLDQREVVRRGGAGVYGLLWIPAKR